MGQGVLFELTPEGGLERWVSGKPASRRWEGRAEAWSGAAPQGGERRREEEGPAFLQPCCAQSEAACPSPLPARA